MRIKRDPKALAARYKAGATLRQIGSELGMSYENARYYMLKLPAYRSLVGRILRKRIRAAAIAFDITRTRADSRRLKHSIAMLRRHRPKLYKRRLELAKPKRCSGCAKPIQARQSAGLWIWNCEHCGKGGIERKLI